MITVAVYEVESSQEVIPPPNPNIDRYPNINPNLDPISLTITLTLILTLTPTLTLARGLPRPVGLLPLSAAMPPQPPIRRMASVSGCQWSLWLQAAGL